VVTGGVWAAFQQNLARLLGYAVIIESGFSLLALGIGNRTGVEIFVSLFPGRLISIGLWALALSLLGYENFRDINSFQGLLHRRPFASGALLMSIFSLGGLPLLAVFPTRLYLLENLAQVTPVQAVWTTLGGVSLLISGLRLLASMLKSESPEWKLEEKWSHIIFLAGGMFLLIIMGIFPQWILPVLGNMLSGFEHLF
jgi:NADH-quinone oxidoreductase subunit N